jgi:hypothetical protein
MWKREERKQECIGWNERKEGVECVMRRERESSGEMRGRERKERGDILNEEGREIEWMKEIWKRRERIEKEFRVLGQMLT